MTTLFQRDPQVWRDIGGNETAEEIMHQPAMWRELAANLTAEKTAIATFLGDCLRDPRQRVILCGAGSSAYIGEIVADELNAVWPCQIRAVSTTSLLTHPELYIETDAPTLLVSFARSGNSPESTAAVQLLRDMVRDVKFLNITCNPIGQLAQQGEQDLTVFNLMMPPDSCDRGFAMTSSFTCMLLAALCVLNPDRQLASRLITLAGLGEHALREWSAPVDALAVRPVRRVVYLGSGPLEALAKEAALKILELTGGKVMATANTALGFRHGPKAALNQDTLVILFRSIKPLARRYEDDLLQELHREQVVGHCVTVGPYAEISSAVPSWSDAWLASLWLLMAQQYALHQSALLLLRPDNPFASGTVNRVVQGVTIYSYNDL